MFDRPGHSAKLANWLRWAFQVRVDHGLTVLPGWHVGGGCPDPNRL